MQDENGNQELDDDAGWRHCGNDYASDMDSDSLCLNGLLIHTNDFFQGAAASGLYYAKVYVAGKIGEIMLPYITSKVGSPDIAGMMASPLCPDVLCPSTCTLKVSEISLLTKEC